MFSFLLSSYLHLWILMMNYSSTISAFTITQTTMLIYGSGNWYIFNSFQDSLKLIYSFDGYQKYHFQYLRYIIPKEWSTDGEVRNRIVADWLKRRSAVRVLCDSGIRVRLKCKSNRRAIRPSMLNVISIKQW